MGRGAVGLCCVLLGCASTATSEPSPERVAAVEAPPKTVAEPQPAEDEATVAEADAVASVDEAGPEVAPPTKAQARVASRAKVEGKLAILAPIVSLPKGRAAVLWKRRAGSNIEAVLVLLEHHADEGWSVAASTVAQTVDGSWSDDPKVAATLRADDYDDDGKVELLLRVRYPEMCPGGGPATSTSLTLFRAETLEPGLRTGLRFMLDAYPQEEIRGRVSHVDVDGDGHRDVEIRFDTRELELRDGEEILGPRRSKTNTWIYEPTSDAWTLREDQAALSGDCTSE